MKYNFDETINRNATDCVKWDIRKQIFGESEVLPMWVADMDFKTPDFIVEAMKKRMSHEIFGYSVRQDDYFQAIIKWLYQRHKWKVEQEHIVFCPGIVPALNLCVQAYTQPGDKIIIQPPVYFPFKSSVLENGRQLVTNQLCFENNRYSMDFDDLKKKIDRRTKMILISNPHNPVGRSWTFDELKELSDICLKNNILMISDEIHHDLTLKPFQHTVLANISDEVAAQSVILTAPSKTFNLAGLSTSSVIISNLNLRNLFITALEKVHIGGGNIFGNIASTAAYTHGDAWLSDLLDYISANVNFLDSYLQKNLSHIKMIRPEATYMAWLDFRELNMSDSDLKHFLIHTAKLGLVAGTDFGQGGEGFQRINLACPHKTVEKAAELLNSAIKEMSNNRYLL